MHSEILALKVTSYNYVKDGERKQGAEVTYLTGNVVPEGYGNNKAAGLEFISMFADYKCYDRLVNDLPCYAEASFDPTTRRDSFGNDMITLRMVDVKVLGPATVGRDLSAPASNNGAVTPSVAVPAK